MRITIAQGAFLPVPPLMGGAVEKVWYALGQEFAARGHQVTHVSRRYPGLPEDEEYEGVRYLRVGGYSSPKSLALLKALDLAYSLKVRLRLPPADILVTHTFWLPMLVRSARPGRLYVHVARYPKRQMRFYAHAARLQTVSTPIRDAIVREVPHLAGKVKSIPYPVLDSFSRDAAAPPREKRILYVGRVHPEKGIELLLQAAVRFLPAVDPAWKLVIVGPAEARHGGGGDDYLRHLLRVAEPLGDRVEWTGPIFAAGELRRQYRRASLFVYPSLAERGETFGLAPLEAMAQGCPVLVSSLECFGDFIVPGESGFVFDHRAPEAAGVLAVKFREILAEPERLEKVGEAGLRRSNDFSLPRVAEQYLADFQSLLDQPQ